MVHRSRVMEEALNIDFMSAPRRTITPQKHQLKHCHYHCNFGHTMEDCWSLKDKIEELVQASHLRRFVQGNRENSRRLRTDEKRNWDHREERGTRNEWESREGHDCWEIGLVRVVINIIVGGFIGRGTTSSSWKRHLRAISLVYSIHRKGRKSLPPITFTNANFKTINSD